MNLTISGVLFPCANIACTTRCCIERPGVSGTSSNMLKHPPYGRQDHKAWHRKFEPFPKGDPWELRVPYPDNPLQQSAPVFLLCPTVSQVYEVATMRPAVAFDTDPYRLSSALTSRDGVVVEAENIPFLTTPGARHSGAPHVNHPSLSNLLSTR